MSKSNFQPLIRFLATGFYIGLIPFMPGTFGTLLALPFAFLLMLAGSTVYAVVALAMIFISSLIAELYEQRETSVPSGSIASTDGVGGADRAGGVGVDGGVGGAQSGMVEHDASEIVIDEVAGLLITLLWLPMTWQTFVFGFLLFRFFDILKPFPISYIDRKVKGGLGVVLDDVAAGVVCNVILQVIYTKTPWLGVQLYGA